MGKNEPFGKSLMQVIFKKHNEQFAADAFSAQSVIFDELYGDNEIIRYKRERVRNHVLQLLKPQSSILELNNGTGEDAIFFAQNGHNVHATDISNGMQEQLTNKVAKYHLQQQITNELCSFNNLVDLKNRGPYDHIFSNFAGLNCTGELDKVLLSLPALLKQNGIVTLVIMPKFCLWETLLVFKGKFRTAFRRWFSCNGSKAHVEGTYFTCWYYDTAYVINTLKDSFNVISVEGLCTIVPPSYIEGLAFKYPKTCVFLKKAEDKLKSNWPWKYIGDYYIISLIKK